jgi:hypothetical protein
MLIFWDGGSANGETPPPRQPGAALLDSGSGTATLDSG